MCYWIAGIVWVLAMVFMWCICAMGRRADEQSEKIMEALMRGEG